MEMNEILSKVDHTLLSQTATWDEIRAIIAEIPSAEELAALCEKLGAFYKPEQIGIDPALSEDMLSVSAAIRNRLTLIRMRRVLDFGE